jgi:integrase
MTFSQDSRELISKGAPKRHQDHRLVGTLVREKIRKQGAPIMASRFHFTKRSIDSLPMPAEGKPKEYFDTQQKNLCLIVRHSGSNTFFVRRKIEGVSHRILIGRYPDLSVEQARNKASIVLAQIAIGENPAEKRKEEKLEANLGEVVENYLAGYARIHCRRSAEMEKDFNRYFKDWANRKATKITRSEAQERINALQKKHGAGGANHGLALIRAATNWNIKHGYLRDVNPWAGLEHYKMRARERFLKPDEIPKFFESLFAEPDELMRDFILMSLFTGARRTNVLSMSWKDIDLTLGIWRIPLTKNGESQTIPLTKSALEILERRSGASGYSDWVFPGKVTGAHLVEPKRAWQRVLARAQIEDFRLHDLRRTLGSYMAINNSSLQIIGKALGHKSTAATQIYARLSIDPIRDAMESAQDIITKAQKKQPAMAIQ